MRYEWKQVILNDVVDILGDGIHGTPKYSENGEYAFINGNNLVNGEIRFKDSTKRVGIDEYNKHKKALSDRTILVSINGTLGNVAVYRGEKVILGKSACYFNVSKNVSKDYIRFMVMSPDFQSYLENQATGTTIKNVSLKQMREYPFLLPPFETQENIAAILLALTNKIKLNQRINENLERQVITLFQHMFIKCENSKRCICPAGECFDITIGKTPPRKEPQWFTKNRADYVWVSISDMGNWGLYISDSSEYLTHEAVEKFNVRIVPDNTVLLSFKLTVGRVAITDGNMATNEAIAHFKTVNPEINEYLYCYLKNFDYQTMGSTSSIATAVNSKIIKRMPFIVPTDEELFAFHEFAGPMFAMIKSNQQENVRLATLRDALLPKLMSGEIDIIGR